MGKIVLTGGGTAGHVTPNLALFDGLRAKGFELFYIGTENGIEHELVKAFPYVKYYAVSAGKLRRYIDLKNLTDPFKVVKGYAQALKILRGIKPDILFSKGGYVAVPVVMAAATLKIPVVIHESDLTPGLATKLSMRAANKICVTFKQTLDYVNKEKAVHTGSPIRPALFKGSAQFAKTLFQLDDKPLLLFMGGSLGARSINNTLRQSLPMLLKKYNVFHICGKGNLAKELDGTKGYIQKEYVSEELPHVMAAAEVIISRAGSNSINEFLALKKPMLLIPLPKSSSRGDQIDNANAFKAEGYAEVLSDEDLSPERLSQQVDLLYKNRLKYVKAMEKAAGGSGTENVLNVIMQTLKARKK